MTSPVNNHLKVYPTDEIVEIIGKDFFKQESAKAIADKTTEFANAAMFEISNQYLPPASPISLVNPDIEKASQVFCKRQANGSIETTFCNKLRCQANVAIYDYLDKNFVKKLIFPCLVATTTSFAINLIMHMAAIVEDIFRSSIHLLKSPFKENLFDEVKISWKIIKNIPNELASITGLFIAYFLLEIPCCFLEPKMIVVSGFELSQLYKKHLKNNSLYSQEFYEERNYLNNRSYAALLAWQFAEARGGLVKGNDKFNELTSSRWIQKYANTIRT